MSANDEQIGGQHYKGYAIQPWDFFLANKVPYLEACIIKYTLRWRSKNGLEDLQKARHYLDKLIEVAMAEEAKAARQFCPSPMPVLDLAKPVEPEGRIPGTAQSSYAVERADAHRSRPPAVRLVDPNPFGTPTVDWSDLKPTPK